MTAKAFMLPTSRKRDQERDRLRALPSWLNEAVINLRRAIGTKRTLEWQRKNPEKVNRKNAAWVRNNKSKVRAVNTAQKARRKLASGTFTGREIKSRYEEQCGMCAYCLSSLNGTYHVEHVTPLSRGGTNFIENIVCSCARCNLSKGDSTIVEFLSRRTA